MHSVRQPLAPRLDDQMEVVVEEDPRDAVPCEPADRPAGELRPVVAIVVVADDALPRDAAGRDVEDAVGGEHPTRQTGHAATLAAVGARAPPTRWIVTRSCVSCSKGHGRNGHAWGLSPIG